MQIVIEIPEEDYERLKVYEKAPFCSLTSRVYEAIANGTPLSEHGRLIDADAYIDKHAEWGWLDDIKVYEFNKITPTIIPATDRTATWKRIGSDVLGFIDMYECSNCGAHPPKKQIGVTWGWDFVDCCPKCRAKMISATEEEKHCKACKYSDNGMINVESERCKACYYDGRLGGNCLFVPKQPATKEGE